MKNNTNSVLFISFGGPEKREDIRPFLVGVTRGHRIPPERIEEVARHYEKIGGASPLNAITSRQAGALQQLLNDTAPHPLPLPRGERVQGEGGQWKVYVGNRHWHPFLEDTLRKMASDGIQRAIGFVTAAYRTEASWERYLKAVDEARMKIGPHAPTIDYVEPWCGHPLFIDAIAARVREVLNLSPSPLAGEGGDGGRLRESHPLPQSSPTRGEETSRPFWVFTAHSIPVAMANDSQYVQELAHTAGLVSREFNVQDWTLAYTSRSGPPKDRARIAAGGSPREAWLEPDVSDMLRELAKDNVRNIVLIPIGFLADHVEVLYDLDVEAKGVADELRIRLTRAQTVGDHPLFIQMIADVVRKRAQLSLHREKVNG